MMSICYSTISVSFSISVTASMITYIQTEVVYYAYTAVAYSLYRSFYINVFTFYYQSSAAPGGSNIVIITACTAVTAVVLVSLVIVILIKIRSRKQASPKQEAENLEQNDFEHSNSFYGVLSVSNIEEDPFADDFKEDKFMNKI